MSTETEQATVIVALKAEVERLIQLDSMKQNFMEQLAAKTTELKTYKEAEELVSNEYIEVRKLVNAFDTNYGGENRFEVTKQKIRDLHSKCERLEKDFEEAVNEGARYHARCVKLEKELKDANEQIELEHNLWRESCDNNEFLRRESNALRAQVAQLSAALEKKDEALQGLIATYWRNKSSRSEFICSAGSSHGCDIPKYWRNADEALALKPNSTALDDHVKPLLDALEQAERVLRDVNYEYPKAVACCEALNEVRAAIQNWNKLWK